jgi:hypothetical protein
VAVGAQDTEVLEPVVSVVTIDVVEREGKGAASPFLEATLLAVAG